MIDRRRLLMTTLAAGPALALGIRPAAARTYRLTIASSHPTALPWVGVLSSHVVPETNKRLEAMGSPDRVEWTEAYGGALYGFEDTLEAVEEGLTDAGWVGTLWEESKMPLQNITYYTPFVSDDLVGLLQVMNDLHDQVTPLRDAWETHNQVLLGSSGVETYHLFTKFPVASVGDLKGKKILAPGPSANWISALGAVPVNGSLTTYYNQLQTGVAEGCITIVTGYVPNKLFEVAPIVTLVGIGAHVTGGFAINRDTWNGLGQDVQKVLRTLGREYSRLHAEEVERRYTKFLGDLRANPKVTVASLPSPEKQRWIQGLPNIAGTWAQATPSGPEVLKAYMAAIRASGVTPGRDWDQEAS